jgi:hypothetical protein
LFVDIEASSLAMNGYPIEIGWAPVIGADGKLASVSHMVRATLDWREDGHWAEDSAKVHGIVREDLERNGRDVIDLLPILGRTFEHHLLVTDAPDTDLRWMAQIHEAVDRPFPWRLHDLDAVRRGMVAERGLNPRTAYAALDAADQNHPRPHRAGENALRMAKLTES